MHLCDYTRLQELATRYICGSDNNRADDNACVCPERLHGMEQGGARGTDARDGGVQGREIPHFEQRCRALHRHVQVGCTAMYTCMLVFSHAENVVPAHVRMRTTFGHTFTMRKHETSSRLFRTPECWHPYGLQMSESLETCFVTRYKSTWQECS